MILFLLLRFHLENDDSELSRAKPENHSWLPFSSYPINQLQLFVFPFFPIFILKNSKHTGRSKEEWNDLRSPRLLQWDSRLLIFYVTLAFFPSSFLHVCFFRNTKMLFPISLYFCLIQCVRVHKASMWMWRFILKDFCVHLLRIRTCSYMTTTRSLHLRTKASWFYLPTMSPI